MTKQDRHVPDDVELADYIWVVWHHRWLIVVGSVLSTVVAFGVASLQSSVYQATAVIAATGRSGDAPLPPAALVKLRALSQSAAVIDRSLEPVRAQVGPIPTGAFVSGRLLVEHVRESNLMSFSVRLPDPEAAATVATRIAHETVAAYGRTLAEESPADLTANDDLAEARAEFERARDRLATFRVERRLDELRAPRDAVARFPLELAAIDAQIEGERAALARTEQDLMVAAQEGVTASRAAAEKAKAALLEFRLRTRLDELRQRREAAARLPVEVAALAAQIASARASLGRMEKDLAATERFVAAPRSPDAVVRGGPMSAELIQERTSEGRLQRRRRGRLAPSALGRSALRGRVPELRDPHLPSRHASRAPQGERRRDAAALAQAGVGAQGAQPRHVAPAQHGGDLPRGAVAAAQRRDDRRAGGRDGGGDPTVLC